MKEYLDELKYDLYILYIRNLLIHPTLNLEKSVTTSKPNYNEKVKKYQKSYQPKDRHNHGYLRPGQ